LVDAGSQQPWRVIELSKRCWGPSYGWGYSYECKACGSKSHQALIYSSSLDQSQATICSSKFTHSLIKRNSPELQLLYVNHLPASSAGGDDVDLYIQCHSRGWNCSFFIFWREFCVEIFFSWSCFTRIMSLSQYSCFRFTHQVGIRIEHP
jgi:hypothetical protein